MGNVFVRSGGLAVVLVMASGFAHGALADGQSDEECLPGNMAILADAATGDEYGVVDWICRKGLEKDARKKSVRCKSLKPFVALSSAERENFADWCAAHPIAKVPSGAKFSGGRAPTGGLEFEAVVKKAWSTGTCYVQGTEKCAKGRRVLEGCSLGGTVTAKFFYSPDCRIEAKTNSAIARAGAKTSGGEIGTAISETKIQQGRGNKPMDPVTQSCSSGQHLGSDNHCVSNGEGESAKVGN